MKTYTPPIKLILPLPSYSAKLDHNISTYGGNMRIRCSDKDYDMIRYEAEELGLTIASFGRWTLRYMAIALKKHREANSSDNEGTP